MSAEEKEIDKIKQEIEHSSQKKKITMKEEIDHSIKMPPIAILFFLLYISLALYLIIAPTEGIPPYDIDAVSGEFTVAQDWLLTILLVVALAFLGLGVYFGWFRKEEEEEGEEEEAVIFSSEDESEGRSEKEEESTNDQSTETAVSED